MGVLCFIVFLGGIVLIKQEPYDEKLKNDVGRWDKTGVFAFAIIIAIFIALYWTLDILMEIKTAGFIIVLAFIGIVFIVATILLFVSAASLVLAAGKSREGV
jgi:uncharacterized Tic20 family protein